jgi:hypothetical protein
MTTITTDGSPFFVAFLPATDVGHLPPGVEDWIATWNTANDCYVVLHVANLADDEDVATDETKAWLSDFRAKYPGQDILLVHIDY